MTWSLPTARSFLTVALVLLAGCGTFAKRVRALPSSSIHLPELDPSVELVLPPLGEVTPARLGDGTPVWVSRDLDDSVTVLSCITPESWEESPLLLALWRPTIRRFVSDFVWDEHGRVLGISGSDGCAGDCSDAPVPRYARDLDTFRVTRLAGEPARIKVGQRIRGSRHRLPETSFPSWAEEPSRLPGPPVSVEQALKEPEGTVVFVSAALVFVSGEAPRICQRSDYRDLCPEGSPRLYDLDGKPEREDGVAILTHSGPWLLRRYRDGFVQFLLGGTPGGSDGYSFRERNDPSR